ncbi:hypothetical protein [Streptomyces fulvorobeus]|uniref:Uncharacterized protein n=1 Tax=Streptomyces fulvorobeus TaxID=284028 RepID=A0A7J0C8K8_9ACTN|nr:hypothetical protein [Streptomyces fulvorobeus]NYE41688.1 hypothetical protein [Streptomyces fulvorobeus]GFM98056.1 hypothetical protein Sfulv_28670 [Streptomyces fulvorobeus]
MSPDRSQTAYAESAAGLASRALDALQGIGGTAMVAQHVERAEDPKAALAAIRVVGADLFAPCLLGGAALHPQDAAAVAQSFAVFPPALSPPPPPPEGAAEPWLVAWRDWATAALLARCADPAEPAGPGGADEGLLAPRPSGAPVLADIAQATAAGAGADLADAGSGTRPDATGPGTDWRQWSVRMGQLSTLALPGLAGPVHDAARAAPLALARGATRAVLRRDFPTAARIVRWLALLKAESVPVPLDPAPLVEHLRLHGGGPRLALDVAIAGRLLATETS